MVAIFIILGVIIMVPVVLISVAWDNHKKKKQEQLAIQAEKNLAAQFTSLCDGSIRTLQASGWNISKDIRCFDAGIIIDDVSQKWCAVMRDTMAKTKEYNYSDIIRYEVRENGQSVSKSDGSDAAVGALLFGVTGAVVGAASSTSTISKECTSLQVCISINDISQPLLVFNFVQIPLQVDSDGYKAVARLANELIATLDYMISKR